jgi:protein-S-isoprenylcysteine O-methyltransferase Ste14
MSEQKRSRAAILIVLAAVVVLAPLLGVYAFSPLMFAWGVEPYQLAVAVGVMLAEALAVGALAWQVIRTRN